MLIKRDSEEITGNDFVVKSFDSIEFRHNIVAHAFLGNIIDNFVLVESSNSVNVDRSLNVEHILPLFHILGTIIIAMEWLWLWMDQVLDVHVNWVVWKSTVSVVMSSVVSGSGSNGGSDN